ncbi:S1C family serine protease [Pueribacillus sp. YX66]|uniref:S1C family serine protease n=1 Tax=Pueribacillus sp. YX66 TaxID=3229242 RepID=UPI00358D50F5
MGYYDNPQSENRNNNKNSRSFLAGIIGAVIGAVVVLLAAPKLAGLGLFPSDNNANENKVLNDQNNNTVTQGVSLDVKSDVTEAVQVVSDAVVGVINLQRTNFWEGQVSEAGAGSGVIYKKAGDKAFVVTNEHVVRDATGIEVTLSDGERLEAELVGSDPLMDLAILQVDASKVKKIAEFGTSSSVKPGEPAIAIGNPLGFLEGTVTAGIISNIERTIPVDTDGDGAPDWNAEVIQTDASINPGNSGGALINIAGQVIGINSSKIAQSAVEGIGFAIPIDAAKPIIDQLEKYGEVRRAFLGVSTQDLSEIPAYHLKETLKLPDGIEAGAVVMEVVTGSPAHRAGIKELDVITELDGKEIANVLELRKHLYNKKKVGDNMKITFYRDGKKQEKTVKLVEQTY